MFQRMDAATGNERRPTVAIDDVPESAAGVMRTSAADDDEANQQHELSDPDSARNAMTASCFVRADISQYFIMEMHVNCRLSPPRTLNVAFAAENCAYHVFHTIRVTFLFLQNCKREREGVGSAR